MKESDFLKIYPSLDAFKELIKKDPDARKFLWSGCSWDGEVYFRVDESGDLVDLDDEPLAYPELNHYALAHPVCEPPEVLQAWEKVFGDYEIVQPFPQFDRPTFGRFISTNRTIGVRPGFIKGFFQRRGWVDSSSSGGNITSYHKSSRAWINLSPGIPNNPKDWRLQRIIHHGISNDQNERQISEHAYTLWLFNKKAEKAARRMGQTI